MTGKAWKAALDRAREQRGVDRNARRRAWDKKWHRWFDIYVGQGGTPNAAVSTPADAVSVEQYALFAALRRGERLPPEVAWALTDLLVQVAVTVHQVDTGQSGGATAGEMRGWLAVLGRAQHNLTDEWTKTREEGEERSGRDHTGQASREDIAAKTLGRGLTTSGAPGPGDATATPAPLSSRPDPGPGA